MTTETLVSQNILSRLRENSIISSQEVVINLGDLYYAKDVLTNEKRIIERNIIAKFKSDDTLQENKISKTLLKG